MLTLYVFTCCLLFSNIVLNILIVTFSIPCLISEFCIIIESGSRDFFVSLAYVLFFFSFLTWLSHAVLPIHMGNRDWDRLWISGFMLIWLWVVLYLMFVVAIGTRGFKFYSAFVLVNIFVFGLPFVPLLRERVWILQFFKLLYWSPVHVVLSLRDEMHSKIIWINLSFIVPVSLACDFLKYLFEYCIIFSQPPIPFNGCSFLDLFSWRKTWSLCTMIWFLWEGIPFPIGNRCQN